MAVGGVTSDGDVADALHRQIAPAVRNRTNPTMKLICVALITCLLCSSAFGQVERVWLSHRTNNPDKIVVSWTTTKASESIVRFGTTKEYGREAKVAGTRTLHHVEIPLT